MMTSNCEPRVMRVADVQFLGEQDGKPERLSKDRLVESFKQWEEVQRAYLAQVISGDQVGVALCIKARQGADPNLVRKVGSIFASIFVGQAHLGILFLTEPQESALMKVCAAFYRDLPDRIQH